MGAGIVGILLLLFIGDRVRRFGWRRGLSIKGAQASEEHSSVIFFEKLMTLLARRGMQRDSHLTPLEFASSLDFRSAMTITRAYNRVRFGGQPLSREEQREIEETLKQLEGEKET